ncbi:MAG: HD domain-containing protein [Candidatus Methanoperedens sp.]
MRKNHKSNRYIYDPLYGIIYLPDYIWDIIPCAELQRLREVRICNINSFCLTGGANINRYEHAIGTCYLAKVCLESWPPLNPISETEQRLFSFSALLHDIFSAAFGHSIEYIESKKGFDHEKAFRYVAMDEKGDTYQYKHATLEPIFFGMRGELSSKIAKEDLNEIAKIIAGKGRFGPLINGTIDLDNIDNVYRLAYHIGIVKSGEVPLKLAKSLWIEDGELVVMHEAIPLVEEWHNVRKKLYLLLLQNPEEFSAKCMLSEAIESSIMKSFHPFDWYDVDYEFLKKLYSTSSEISMILSRLMKGDLYGCIGIFSTSKIDKHELFNNSYLLSWDEIPGKDSSRLIEFLTQKCGANWIEIAMIEKTDDGSTITITAENNYISLQLNDKKDKATIMSADGMITEFIIRKENDKLNAYNTSKTELEKELSKIIRLKLNPRFKSAMIALHSIIDVNKTERHVSIRTDKGQVAKIGGSSRQLLIGVFFKNVDLNIYKINKIPISVMSEIRKEVFGYLSNILGDKNLTEVELYAEVEECR